MAAKYHEWTSQIPFPLPETVLHEWGDIIRNNKFYYIEGEMPGNVIYVNKHDMVTKVLEIKEVISKNNDPDKYQSILIDSLGGILSDGCGVGVEEVDDSIIHMIPEDSDDELFLLCEEIKKS